MAYGRGVQFDLFFEYCHWQYVVAVGVGQFQSGERVHDLLVKEIDSLLSSQHITTYPCHRHPLLHHTLSAYLLTLSSGGSFVGSSDRYGDQYVLLR